MGKQKNRKTDNEKGEKLDILKKKKLKQKKIEEKIRDKEEHDAGDIKDKLSDKLDKLSDKVDNLSDKGKLSDTEENLLKKHISETKGKLDVHKEILQKLIKNKIIHHFTDQMTDEILEVIHDEVLFKEKIKEGFYKNKKIRRKLSSLIKNKIIKSKHDK